MDVSKSVEVFDRGIGTAGCELNFRGLIDAVISFYADSPADGLVEQHGDALLFQYGCYDWGSGLRFEVDLTRQFIEVERDHDGNVISQFHLTGFYKPTDALTSIGSGDRWCWSKADLPAFSEWINSHPVLAVVDRLPLLKKEVRWELV